MLPVGLWPVGTVYSSRGGRLRPSAPPGEPAAGPLASAAEAEEEVGAAEEVARWRGMAGAGPVLSVKSVEASGEKPGETSEEKPGEISKEISEDISEEISEEISAGLAWGVDLGGPAVLPG